MKYAYYKGDLALMKPLLFIKAGRNYYMVKDQSYKYPSRLVESDKDWIIFRDGKDVYPRGK
jgi:hypothetical protein